MTALAMMIGMVPMSLGLGEGGEQNAPLGRAVIGGLLFATTTTLFLVPVVYSILRRKDLVPFSEEDATLLFAEDEPERQLATGNQDQQEGHGPDGQGGHNGDQPGQPGGERGPRAPAGAEVGKPANGAGS